MRISFELVTTLQYDLRAVQQQIVSFKSGQKYVIMKKECETDRLCLEKEIKSLLEER
ncbi:hypothetical protein [Hungatella hathewayi]|uniref:hypothetical protein n=1 Tax=Hungatella hathewayi TaxID=154046 RepID=UPI0035636B07